MENAADGRGAYRWYVLTVLTLCYTLSFVDTKLPFILIEQIKYDLHLTDTQLGLIAGPAFSLVYACAAIPIARISDRGGRNIVLGSAVLVWSLFTFAGGPGPDPRATAPEQDRRRGRRSRLHAGVAFPDRRLFRAKPAGKGAGHLHDSSTLGTTIAMAGGGLLAEYASWRVAMFVVGASGLVLTLACS